MKIYHFHFTRSLDNKIYEITNLLRTYEFMLLKYELSKKTNLKIFIFLCLCFFIFYFLPCSATSYNSTNFKIMDPVLSEGGKKSASENFSEKSTVAGPTAIGVSAGTNFIIKSGFQYYDETPPYTKFAAINDGLADDIDEQTSLNTISANWNGIYDPESGLHKLRAYEIKLRRASDNYSWNPLNLLWEENAGFYTTSTKITLSGVDLQTSEIYFFELRAFNNLNMASPLLKTDGVKIIPYLSFTIDATVVSLGELSPANHFTNQATTNLSVSTNAYRGYKIKARSAKILSHNLFPTQQIPDWQGTNEEPAIWDGYCKNSPNLCGFGYRTNDDNLEGVNPARFANPLSFAGFNHETNDLVADHADFVTGKTGEIQNEETEITYKASAVGDEVPGDYTTTIIYIIGVNY